MHAVPPPHLTPQPPQLTGSEDASTQAPLQALRPALQAVVQTPDEQTLPAVHAVAQVPQCAGSLVRSTQLPLRR